MSQAIMRCPYCSKEIEQGAIICKHCSSAVMDPDRAASAEAAQESSVMDKLRPADIEELLTELEEAEAESDLETETASLPASDEAAHHLEQAFALEDRDEYEEALAECDAALRLDPTLADAHNLRGVILEELGREKEALQAYREAVRLDPGFDAARENLQAVAAELQAEQARRAARKADRAWVEDQLVFEAEDGTSLYTWQLGRVEFEPISGALLIYGYAKGTPTITLPVDEITRFEIVEREDISRNLSRTMEGCGGGGGYDLGDLVFGLLFIVFAAVFVAAIDSITKAKKVQVLKLTQSTPAGSDQGWVIHLRSKKRGGKGQAATLEMARRFDDFLRRARYGGVVPEDLSVQVEDLEASVKETSAPAHPDASRKRRWIVAGNLAIILAWAATVFLGSSAGSYMMATGSPFWLAENLPRILKGISEGMRYGFCCTLPVLAFGLFVLWIAGSRAFMAGRQNRSSFIVVTILGIIIASGGGCITGWFGVVEWYF